MNATDWLSGGQRHELATARIQTAARELLADRGLDKFTAEAVAARAGCSRATLYRHVGGKKALLGMVLSDAAAQVSAQVANQTRGLTGTARIVEAVLASVTAIRADPALHGWFRMRRNAFADDYLRGAGELPAIAASLAGISTRDPLGGQWIVRVVLMLLAWPAEDTATEREMVTAYLAPAFPGA